MIETLFYKYKDSHALRWFFGKDWDLAD